MERSKRDLESLVASQKEHLTRYETRLKDVVTAYKGLLKEKEALESSLAAITNNKEVTTEVKTDTHGDIAIEKNSLSKPSVLKDEDVLKTQIITLMNSLATLSAEKSRMEASFQGDKKQLRQQLQKKDTQINEMLEKSKVSEERAKVEVENFKAKLIVERQEREKETNNHMLMIRELQKLYADERHLKENIEMQLNNFKTQLATAESTSDSSSRIKELNAQLKEARNRIKQLEINNNKDGEPEVPADSAAILRQVQTEMFQLKEQHAIAIKSEQRRAYLAEEQSKKLAAIHEDRVANLEARLAELSTTVGTYDRLRLQDQESILVLKKKIQNLVQTGSHNEGVVVTVPKEPVQHITDSSVVVDEIVRLKNLLIMENVHSTAPIDISKIFSIGTDHAQCQEDLNRMQLQLEARNTEILNLEDKIQIQKSHIATLQDKVKVLNRNIDEQEIELKQQAEKLRQAVKEERLKWKDTLAETENECRVKLNEIEQQLQKQRVRSLHLLDEKENEIKTLQTSFEVFAPPYQITTASATLAPSENGSDYGTEFGDVPPCKGQIKHSDKKASPSSGITIGENCHMLHYANEIARKDIEICALRKAKYAAETSLRKAIQDKVSAQEDLSEQIVALETHVDRLERCKTREGANLEYLKNVVISFISTKDVDGKRHMVNAIGAVLQFTPSEVQAINAALCKK